MGKLSLKMSLKEKRKYQQKKRKYQQAKRKMRKRKLIELGTLFSISNLLEESQETILGFLNNYEDKKEYTIIGEKILQNKKTNSLPNDFLERRRYFYKIIRKSALLEKLKLHKENPTTILGYLSKFKSLTQEEINNYSIIGKKIFNKYVTDKERIEILRIFMKHNLDFRKYLKEKYLTNIEDVTYITYLQIKKELEI